MRKRWESRSSKLLEIKMVRKAVAGTHAEDVSPTFPEPMSLGADSPQPEPHKEGGFSAGGKGSLSPRPLNLQHTFSTLGSSLQGPGSSNRAASPGRTGSPSCTAHLLDSSAPSAAHSHSCVHKQSHTFAQTHTHSQMHPDTCVFTHTHIRTFTHKHLCIPASALIPTHSSTHTPTHSLKPSCMCIHIRTYIPTHIPHSYMHSHVHSHTHSHTGTHIVSKNPP